MATREYITADGMTVLWQSDLCTHCEECAHGLPEVFQPTERPWVKINAATPERIRLQVSDCPSGALSIKADP